MPKENERIPPYPDSNDPDYTKKANAVFDAIHADLTALAVEIDEAIAADIAAEQGGQS